MSYYLTNPNAETKTTTPAVVPQNYHLPTPGVSKSARHVLYDPFKSPPNLEEADLHARAKRIGIIRARGGGAGTRCACCQLPVDKVQYALCCPTRDFVQLGVGYYFYFEYIKVCVCVVLTLVLCAGTFQLMSLVRECYMNEQKEQNKCIKVSVFLLAPQASEEEGSPHGKQSFLQSVMNLVTVVVTALIAAFARAVFKVKDRYIARVVHSPSQFALLFSNISESETDDAALEKFLEQHWRDALAAEEWGEKLPANTPRDGACVRSVVRMYRIRQYLRLQQRRDTLEKLIGALPPPQSVQDGDYHRRLRESLQKVSSRVVNFEQAVRADATTTGKKGAALRTDKAVVVFNERVQRKFFYKYFAVGRVRSFFFKAMACCSCCSKRRLGGRRLIARPAPDPLDIIYVNQEMSGGGKAVRVAASYTFFAALLVASFFGLSELVHLQTNLSHNKENEHNKRSVALLSAVYSVCVFTINTISVVLTQAVSRWERRSTYTQLNETMAWKLSWLQFATSAVIPFYLLVRDRTRQSYALQDVIANIFAVTASKAFIVPLTVIFDPLRFVRNFRKAKLKCQGRKSKYKQFEANALYEEPSFGVCDRYAVVNRSVLMAALFTPMFPLGSVLLLIGLVLYYWATKYKLLRNCSFTNSLGAQLNKSMLSVLRLVPLVFAAGDFITEYSRTGNFKTITHPYIRLASLGVAALTFIGNDILQKYLVPLIRRCKCCLPAYAARSHEQSDTADDKGAQMPESTRQRAQSYSDSQQSFMLTYETASPTWALRYTQKRKRTMRRSVHQKPLFDNHLAQPVTVETAGMSGSEARLDPGGIQYDTYARENKLVMLQQAILYVAMQELHDEGDRARDEDPLQVPLHDSNESRVVASLFQPINEVSAEQEASFDDDQDAYYDDVGDDDDDNQAYDDEDDDQDDQYKGVGGSKVQPYDQYGMDVNDKWEYAPRK